MMFEGLRPTPQKSHPHLSIALFSFFQIPFKVMLYLLFSLIHPPPGHFYRRGIPTLFYPPPRDQEPPSTLFVYWPISLFLKIPSRPLVFFFINFKPSPPKTSRTSRVLAPPTPFPIPLVHWPVLRALVLFFQFFYRTGRFYSLFLLFTFL